MGCKVEIRAGLAGDVDAMYALDLICFSEAFRFEWELMRRLACDPAAVVTVAECGEELVGFAIAGLRRGRSGLGAYLSTLDVAPAARRGGLGRRLMEVTERRCAEAGAGRMSLHVWAENGAAIAFYEAMGYVRRGGVRVGYYGEAGDGWAYGKRLLGNHSSQGRDEWGTQSGS